MNDLFNSEIGRINPTIRVEYKDIKPEDSLIKIDAVKLGSVLTEKCGYPPQALVPIQITNATQGDIALARLNLLPKRVEFNNNRIVQNIRDIYKEMLERIDEIPPKDAGKEEDVFVTLLRSKIAQKLFPAYWPYAMLKRTEVPSFFANPDRVEKYLTAAKEGTLDTSKSLPEQRLRAKKFIAKLIELSLKRSMGAVFAHEFEHSNKSNRKLLKSVGLAAAPVVCAGALLGAFGSSISPDVAVASLIPMGGAMMYGLAKGRSFDEQASYDAAVANFESVMSCITVNHEAYMKDIVLPIAPEVRPQPKEAVATSA